MWQVYEVKRLQKDDVASIFNEAYIAILTVEKGVSGFRSTGIYLLKKETFKDEDVLSFQAQQPMIIDDQVVTDSVLSVQGGADGEFYFRQKIGQSTKKTFNKIQLKKWPLTVEMDYLESLVCQKHLNTPNQPKLTAYFLSIGEAFSDLKICGC